MRAHKRVRHDGMTVMAYVYNLNKDPYIMIKGKKIRVRMNDRGVYIKTSGKPEE